MLSLFELACVPDINLEGTRYIIGNKRKVARVRRTSARKVEVWLYAAGYGVIFGDWRRALAYVERRWENERLRPETY